MDTVAGRDSVRSVDRAFSTLELLVRAAPHAVRVTDVAAHIEVDPATASRLLATLAQRGYASRTAQRRYMIGPRALPMAYEWLGRLRAASAAPLERLARATGEAVMLSTLLGTNGAPVAMRWPLDDERQVLLRRYDDGAEHSYPLWATASGRAMLAMLPAAERRRVLPPEPYPALTGTTPTSWQALRDVLRAGERDGLFVEQGEAMTGLFCYAMSLPRGANGEVIAVSVTALGDLTAARHVRIMRALRAESRALRAESRALRDRLVLASQHRAAALPLAPGARARTAPAAAPP